MRGTLSLHLGGQGVVGDERIHPRSSLTPARPLPWGAWLCPQGSGASLPLPPPSLTLGTLSNCTKVAVCQSYPHTRVGSLLPVLSPHCLCSRPGQSPCSPVFLDSSALCVCVCVFRGWEKVYSSCMLDIFSGKHALSCHCFLRSDCTVCKMFSGLTKDDDLCPR